MLVLVLIIYSAINQLAKTWFVSNMLVFHFGLYELYLQANPADHDLITVGLQSYES